jgi:SAM-dependent methyltransferase
VLPPVCTVLEVGSGTGQHSDFFTEQVPGWRWQPTDLDAENLACIAAYRADTDRENFLPPLRLDATSDDWPEGPYDAVFSANMIHIAPWGAALGLFEGAERVLGPEGLLVLYGPFRFSGTFTAESNAAFDARLRSEDPTWGVRDLDDLRRETGARGFAAPTILGMPANNHVLVFART